MDRTDLGSWGDGLPPDELAGALAAALILSARPRPHSWHQESVGINARELLDLVQNAGTPSGAVSALLDLDLVSRWPPARVLLQAWNTMQDDLDYAHFPIRLQIEGWQRHDPGWVLHLLRETSGSTNVCSAYLAQPREGGGRRWHMPLRVGFLPDAGSQDLRERLGSADYDWLTELVTLRPGVESCDLLLLPHALQGAMAALKALPFRPGTAVVLVLEQGYVPVEDALPPAKDLQTITECGALGWLDIPYDDLVGWFSDLVRELSHDHPWTWRSSRPPSIAIRCTPHFWQTPVPSLPRVFRPQPRRSSISWWGALPLRRDPCRSPGGWRTCCGRRRTA